VDQSAHKAGRPIRVGTRPRAVAVEGGTVYVANSGSGTVTPIRSGRAGRPIRVGADPRDIVVHGRTAGQVSLVDPRTRHVARPVPVGGYPVAAAISG
jgi:YVTN family beta-propeller protein